MLEFLELLGRAILALFRIGVFLEFLWRLSQGVLWLVSPAFRREVRESPEIERFAVYYGVFLAALILLALGGVGVAVLRSQ